MRQLLTRIAQVLVILGAIVGIMAWSGIIDGFWFTFGILGTITMAPILNLYLLEQFHATARTRVLILTVVYGILFVVVVLPPVVEQTRRAWSATFEALGVRHTDADLRIADVAMPVGTGIRALTAEHRRLREVDLTTRVSSDLQDIRNRLTTRTLTASEAAEEEQVILTLQTRELAAINRVSLNGQEVERLHATMREEQLEHWLGAQLARVRTQVTAGVDASGNPYGFEEAEEEETGILTYFAERWEGIPEAPPEPWLFGGRFDPVINWWPGLSRSDEDLKKWLVVVAAIIAATLVLGAVMWLLGTILPFVFRLFGTTTGGAA